MSGIYLSTGNLQHAKVAGSRLKFTDDTSLEAGHSLNLVWAVTRVDSMSLWGPAHDESSGLTILLGGRVSFDEEVWQKAERTPYIGGLACKYLLDSWIKRRSTFTEELNGAFLVIVIDTQEHLVHFYTDRLGVYPIYKAKGSVFSICSHPDVLADDLKAKKLPCDIDWTTVAECLGTASSVQPYTYYQQIIQLEPASEYIWEITTEVKLLKCRPFWVPAYIYEDPLEDIEELAEELAVALKNAVRRRTLSRLGNAAVMLSGGADSRVALYGATDPSKMTCFTLYDEPNAELTTSSKLAKTACAKHVTLKRDIEYYGASAEESVRISGGTWSIVDSHYLGHFLNINQFNLGSLLTGCYADYMFKGLSINRKHKKLIGRNLPIFEISEFSYDYYQTHTKLNDKWQVKINDRLKNRYEKSVNGDYNNNCLVVENLRLRPLIRESDAMGRLILWRTLPWDPLLSDIEILNVYGKMSVSSKLNGIVFGKAVSKVVGEIAGKIKNSNYGTPVDATINEKIAWFLLGVVKRKISSIFTKEDVGNKLATTGSWPNWTYLISHSKSIEKLWSTPTKYERDIFSDMLGYDPWCISIQEWARKDHMLFSRLLTVKIWLKTVLNEKFVNNTQRDFYGK